MKYQKDPPDRSDVMLGSALIVLGACLLAALIGYWAWS
jgi:hypothetical protein